MAEVNVQISICICVNPFQDVLNFRQQMLYVKIFELLFLNKLCHGQNLLECIRVLMFEKRKLES